MMKKLLEELREVADQLEEIQARYGTKLNCTMMADWVDLKRKTITPVMRCIKAHNDEVLVEQTSFIAEKMSQLSELKRFSGLQNLPYFKIICTNDTGREPHMSDYEWVRNGKTYKVYGDESMLAIDQLCFIVTDIETNEIVRPPSPLVGFGSSRFVPIAYEKYN